MRRRRPTGARVTTLTGLGLRSLRARPLRSLLTASAVVLGVGMMFGVLLLVGTIHSTFSQLYDSIYGRTDLVVSGAQSQGSLPASMIIRVRTEPGVASASGDIGSVFRTVNADGTVNRAQNAQVYVVGVDYAQPATTTAELVAGRDPIGGRGEIELDRDWAHSHHIGVGSRIKVSTPTGLATLRVSGLFSFQGGLNLGGYGTGSLALTDARRLMDKPRTWDEISVRAGPGVSLARLRDRLSARLGGGVEVATVASKTQEALKQLSSLDVVLYFFSGIALFVGIFLILNSFNMTVLQRQREIGTLRALGASPRRVARAILIEAGVIAVIGSLAGLGLGAGLAVLLVKAMQSFGMPVAHVEFSGAAVITAVIVGLLATLAGAGWPALRAGRTAPVKALIGEGELPKPLGMRRAIVGLALFVPSMLAGGLLWFGTNTGGLKGIGAILTTMIMFLGMVMLAPFVVLPLVRMLAYPIRRVMPAEGRLAADAARANPTRTAATAATLIVALSVVVVNATIAASFVGSVKSEFNRTFARDLTVQPIGYQEMGPPQTTISPQLRAQIAALPQAGTVVSRRNLYLSKLPVSGEPGLLVAYEPYLYRRVDRIDYLGAPVRAVLRGLANGGIVPSQAYADAHGMRVGDRVTLRGPSSVRHATVVGLADTYDAGGQTIQMSLHTMAAVYGVSTDSQLLISAASPKQRGALTRAVDALLARSYPGLEAQSNVEFKKSATDAINQQFGFFNAIVAIAVLVGVLGIVNTLSMSVIERTREIGVLRALGASRWRVRRTMTNESLLISLAGTFAGIVVGAGIAVVWIVSMRLTSFPGLSMRFPYTLLVTIAVLGVVIGAVAAILPARRAARLEPLAAIRYE